MESIWLSVVIPAYNEETRLRATLIRVVEYLEERGRSYEILVVDDGSRDSTAEVARRFSRSSVQLVQLPGNRGKGAAVRTGVARSRGDWVLLCDADLSTPIEDLEVLEGRAPGHDLVLGSRALPDSNVTVHQPLYRELMGKTFNGILRLLGLVNERDTQCGFKLLRGEVARSICRDLTIDRFAYDVELVWLAKRRGWRVAEQGVRWENSPDSRVHPIWDSARMLADVLRIRWRHRD